VTLNLLTVLAQFVTHCESWLDAHPDNVVAVHCKAGKGRTGVMVTAYLNDILYILAYFTTYILYKYNSKGITADDVLEYYSERRTQDGKGITIPSQIRFVRYFEALLHNPEIKLERKKFVKFLRVHTIPEYIKLYNIF
jgi:phosphatidylinositol-3,4,5-trisphosphate 3-phosphatase/dual-specificity protein phosphatase PTEN